MNSIEARNLSKIYRMYPSPGHRLREIVFRRPYHTQFAALKDVSFTVSRGESFGVIGENGAGKSTLLKILSRTLKPTSGELSVSGRVAALLELGAGFNPEFSGEENIYLNAYLLGLSKQEISERKAEIIAFSELGDFISRPVKTYSSGMQVRLAFSIATSVNPDILVVDEALSVGDQHFQKKCIDRIMQFRAAGKTIFFCSHALYLVQELCAKSIWLKNGRMEKTGATPEVVNAYNDWIREREAGFSPPAETAPAESGADARKVWIESAAVTDDSGRPIEIAKTGQDIFLRAVIRTTEKRSPLQGHIAVGLNRNDEEAVYGVTTKMDGLPPVSFDDGRVVRMKIPSVPLLPGQYFFQIFLGDDHAVLPYDTLRTKMFSVENLCQEIGIVRLEHAWIIEGSAK